MRRKCPACRGRDFIPSLRERYCELVNDAFERAGLARRWDPRRYGLMGIAKEPGERLGTKAAALERQGIATAAGTRNAGREFDYRLRQLQHALAGMADEARVQVLEVAHVLAAARRPGAGPELTEAAVALSQGAQDYTDARAIQAAALVERNLASWMREATPARLEQVSGSAIANAAQAGHLAARLRSRGDRLLRQRSEALEKARAKARRALEALELRCQRFDDEELADRLRDQRVETGRLKRHLAQGRQGRRPLEEATRAALKKRLDLGLSAQADLERQVRARPSTLRLARARGLIDRRRSSHRGAHDR